MHPLGYACYMSGSPHEELGISIDTVNDLCNLKAILMLVVPVMLKGLKLLSSDWRLIEIQVLHRRGGG